MRRRPSRYIAIAMCFSTASTSCRALQGDTSTQGPTTLVIAFWDYSGSIDRTERTRWKDRLLQRTADLGEGLWDETLSDCVIVLPLHGATASAAPLAEVCFPGGEYADNERRKRRAALVAALDGADTVRIGRVIRADTDIMATITRAIEYVSDDSVRLKLMFFSDMFHSMDALNFERSGVLDGGNAALLAREIVTDRHWTAATLREAEIEVYLPGTASGATGNRSPDRIAAVKMFWLELFDRLGARVRTWQRL